ncbi:MAG: GNAT family N-acetyltransferase [Magnetococcales bacterium]|nr:GNAT family N-acetyltransferase [Magnetococcales bacterium]MBF0116928.1 GNAT family N-acetyltransferase [Magnetococcales bacterium]
MCGEPELDDYLARYARQHQESGVARIFVAVGDAQPERVLGYHALTVGSIAKTHLPEEDAKRFPAFPLPVVRVARLAVDQTVQGQGLGEHLLLDALFRCLRVADDVGLMAVVIDAKHEDARFFYARYDCTFLPDQPLTLWLPVRFLRRVFADL